MASYNLFLAEGNFSNSAPKPISQVFMDLTLSLCLWATLDVNKIEFSSKAKPQDHLYSSCGNSILKLQVWDEEETQNLFLSITTRSQWRSESCWDEMENLLQQKMFSLALSWLMDHQISFDMTDQNKDMVQSTMVSSWKDNHKLLCSTGLI